MRTREADLVALAEAAVSRRSSEMALLIDLSAVPNIDDPAFFRVLVGRLQRRAEQLDAKRFDLAHHKICFVVPASAAMALDHAVKSLSKLLTDHGKPPIEEKLFHLARRP